MPGHSVCVTHLSGDLLPLPEVARMSFRSAVMAFRSLPLLEALGASSALVGPVPSLPRLPTCASSIGVALADFCMLSAPLHPVITPQEVMCSAAMLSVSSAPQIFRALRLKYCMHQV